MPAEIGQPDLCDQFKKMEWLDPKSVMVSRDDGGCSQVELTADNDTLGVSSTLHIQALQPPATPTVSVAAYVK